MQPPEPYLIFTRKLNELGLRYMVSGSVAAIYCDDQPLLRDTGCLSHPQPPTGSKSQPLTSIPHDELHDPVLFSLRQRT